MNSSSPILRLLKPGRQNDQKPNSMLYSAAALGAIGSLIAPELMFAEVVQTFVLPQGYRKTDDGRVILRTQDGQPLYLTEEQFVILEDGLLLVTDELAQNTMQNLPVMGALRANGLLTGTPLASDDGGFIETTTDNPVWTGGRGPIQDFALGTHQLAQAGIAKVTEETVDTVDTGLLLGSGVSLIALVSGLFGATASSDQTEAETPDGGTGQPPSGGGGGGGTTFSGTVIKGPLVNAFVFFDENGNGLFDAGEPNFTTSSTGGFSISSSAANPKLIVTTSDQTIDTNTGTILSGMTFKSPLGASVVSPLTTMMEETGLSVAEIKSVLGLPATVNPLTFNPYAPGVNAADALAAEQVSAQTMVTLAAFAAAAAGTEISQQDAFAAALSALSSGMQSKNSGGGTLDLTDPADLAAVQSAFTTAFGSIPGVTADQTTAINGIIGDATTAIQNVNNKIASITNTDLNSAANGNIFGLLQVLQDQVEKAAEDEKTTPGSGTIGFTDPTAVDNAATNSAPTDIDLSASSISEDASSLVVGVLTTTDDSTSDFNFTYEIAEIEGSNDHAAFSINQTNGELSFVAQPDFETQSSYTITIIATDEGGKSFSETFTITVMDAPENEAPTVTGVVISGAESDGSTPKAGTLVAGDKILVTVTVDENITVDTSGGTPQYTIDVGGVSKTAGYVSGSGGTSLVFAYEVQAGDLDDAGGITSDTSALDANSGTLQDSDGHDLDLTTIAVSAGANTVGVDAASPTVTGVVISGAESDGSTPKAGTLVAGDKILVTVTVDENITVDTSGGTPQYTIDVGGVSKTAGYVSGSGGTSLVFAYEVQAGDLDDAGGITSDTSALDANSGTLQDSDGHDLDLTTIAVSAGANTVGVDAESKFSAIKISGSVAGDRFGRWISTAGDFDGDGVLDVAVSASALTEAGSSFVLSGAAINSLGSETHHEIDLSTFSPNQYVQIDGIDAEDHSGHRIVHAGDLNGDGFDDIAISAIRAEDPARSQNHGEVYVVWGSSDSFEPTIINLAGLNGTNGVRIIGLDGWSGTGLDLRAAGDVDGDGTPDILIGSEGLGNPSALTESDSYLVYGDALLNSGETFDLSAMNGSNGIRIFGADDGDRSGISVAGGGDVDGDDLSDVLIGAFWAEDATGSTNEGETYLVYGSHLKDLRSQQVSSINLGSLGSSEGVRIYGRDEEDGSGHSVDFIGDIDGDGKSEVLVGAHLAEDGDKQTQGESYLVFGGYLNDQVATFDLGSLDGTNGVRLKGANAGDESAYHVASAGDVDNDGKGDFLIGARHADNGTRLDTGIAYVVFGDSLLSGNATLDLGSTNGTTGVAILGIDAGDHAGISVNSAGDLDGDGFDDVLIGVDYATPSGEFYVLSGYSIHQAAQGNGVSTAGVIDLAVDFGWGSSNSPPSFGSSTASVSVPENTSETVYTAAATDADGDTPTYHLVGGADQALFDIDSSSGALTFKSAPDYETPTDASSPADNVYEVQIQADDGNGGTATQTVSVAVSDVVDHVAVFAGSGAYGDQKSVRSWDVNGNGFSDLHVRPISGETSNYKFIIRDDQIYFDGEVRIISDASDYSIYGSVNSDRWSNSRFGSPDINADGLADLLYTSTVGSELVGKIQDESNFLTGFDLDLDAQVSSQTFKVSGFSGVVALAASVGDLDGDSRHEIIIVDNDYLYLIEGNSLEAALGQNVSISDLLDDGTGGSRASYSTPNHGSAAAGIGDRNNDGVVDFLVGQPYGSIDIISAAEFLTDDEDITIHNSTSVMTLSSYVPFGYTAEAIPDVDNDGISELLISAGRSGHTSGSVFVVFGSHINDNFSTNLDLDSLDGSDGVKISGTHNSWFGHSSTFIDDLDGDGIPELVVSSPEGSSQEYGEGAVYVIYGDSLIGTDGHLNLTDILSSSVGIIEGSDSGNMFGHNMDVVGDLTGDGLGEIAIGGETVDLGYSGGGIYVIPSELIPGPGETLNMSSFSFEII